MAILLALALWEAILETTVIRFPGSYNHPVTGRITKPGLYIQGSEGYCITQINSMGFRGENISRKQPGEYRMMLLGDSFTEGFHVAEQKTFSFLVQKSLNQQLHSKRFKTVNLGKSGAAPAAYIHLADYYKKAIEPDLTIIQLNDGDFIRDAFDATACFYLAKDHQTYKTVYNNTISSYDFLNQIPQLTALMKPLFSLSVVRIGFDNLKKMLSPTPPQSAIPVQKLDYSIYEDVIAWSVRELKAKYPNLLVLFIPDLGLAKTDIEKQLELHCKQNNIEYIDMREPFLRYLKNHPQPVSGFNNTTPGLGHLNASGHQLVALELSNYLKRKVPK